MNLPDYNAKHEDRGPDPDGLCAAVESLARTLNPNLRRDVRVGMDTTLEGDLGFDSLSRVELLSRLERDFGVSMAERDMAEAETPRDILRALKTGERRGSPPGPAETSPPRRSPDAPVEAPEDAKTLIDALLWHAASHPERTHVHLLEDGAAPRQVTYSELLERGRASAAGLRAHGHEPGGAVAIMLPTSAEYLFSFIGVLLAGGVPVPVYPPARISQLEDHLRRHARILENARVTHLITFDEAKKVSRLLAAQVETLRGVITVDDLDDHGSLSETSPADGDSVAFLQYTSGSTGNPKGVVLSHANVLTNLDAMHQALEVSPSEVFVSWLPLYHDMGLIGAWLGSVVYGFPLVLMSPLAFLRRPESWLKAIQSYGGTLSGGPNFAFELCARRIRDEDIEGLDLSSWRLAFNGAEPVSPSTLKLFAERFEPYGLDRRALTPVYGLAEATLGVAFTPVNRGPRIDRIKRRRLQRDGQAAPADEDESDVVEYVSSGVPIPGFEVRIVDDTGQEAPERTEGEVQFKGPSTTAGYFRNPRETRALFDDEWLKSGDRGYIAEGEVYITGRSKDVVIRGGRNIHPYELEESVADVDGVRRGCVAVFGATDASSATERLIIVAETRETDESRRENIRQAIEVLTRDHLGMPADDIVLAPPHTVLKTSSGKIRRSAMRELYDRGRLVTPGRALWLQVLRIGLAGVVPSLRRLMRRTGAGLFAGYALVLLGLGVAVAWPSVVASRAPDTAFRRAKRVARMMFRLSRVPLIVTGREHVPADGAFVLASNHASYLDGLSLTAVLPRPVGFVAKRELAGPAFSRLFLKHLGVYFVERFDRQRGVEDARAIASALSEGKAVGYFPEGTLHRMPGLLPFQLGAFAAAVDAHVPVVPVVIRGTRSMLRGNSWFLRRGAVRVEFLEPESPPSGETRSEWERAIRLRDAVRTRILERCGEPDLAKRPVLQDLKRRSSTDGR